jgi:hypothetical protein
VKTPPFARQANREDICSPRRRRSGERREEVARLAEKLPVGFYPVLRDFLLRFDHIELAGTHQRAHPSLKLILPLGIPNGLDRTSGLGPEIRVRIRAAEAQGHQVIDLVLRVRSRWKSVLAHDFIVALSGPMTQRARLRFANRGDVGGSACAWREHGVGQDA